MRALLLQPPTKQGLCLTVPVIRAKVVNIVALFTEGKACGCMCYSAKVVSRKGMGIDTACLPPQRKKHMTWYFVAYFWLTSPTSAAQMQLTHCVPLSQPQVRELRLKVPPGKGTVCARQVDYKLLARGIRPTYSTIYIRT